MEKIEVCVVNFLVAVNSEVLTANLSGLSLVSMNSDLTVGPWGQF